MLCDARLQGRGGKWLGGVNKEVDKWPCPVQAHVGRGGGDGERQCKDVLRMLSITSSGIISIRIHKANSPRIDSDNFTDG